MKTTCVNDHAIQTFTFDLSECDAEIIAHINSCAKCKMSAENYLLLSKAIKEEPIPVLAFDLLQLVFDKSESASKKESIYNNFIYTLLVLSIAVVGSTLYLFKDILDHFFSIAGAFSIGFIASIATLVLFVLSFDIIRSFNKKIKMLKY